MASGEGRRASRVPLPPPNVVVGLCHAPAKGSGQPKAKGRPMTGAKDGRAAQNTVNRWPLARVSSQPSNLPFRSLQPPPPFGPVQQQKPTIPFPLHFFPALSFPFNKLLRPVGHPPERPPSLDHGTIMEGQNAG